jgi:hypothetical protein
MWKEEVNLALKFYQNQEKFHNVSYSFIMSNFVSSDPGFTYVWVSNKASKTIGPPGKPKGNVAHIVHCTVSPEIVLMGCYNTHVFTA